MRRAAGPLGLVLVVTAWFVASPHLAARGLGEALQAGDAVALERRVDFPRLRENLKEQLNAKLLGKAGGAAVENPLGAVVVGLASMLVEGVVNAAMTPAGLASLARGHPLPVPGEPPGDAEDDSRNPFEGARTTRDALDRFSLWVPEGEGREIRFVLSLQGFSWRLTNVVLPAA